jgi:ferredoxin
VSLRRGYRGFVRELLKTGGLAALRLQVRTGALHALRSLAGRRPADPVALFLANYGADGIGLPDAAARPLSLAAARCLGCGLCSLECARVGGRPPLDPRDAVLAGARLEIDLARLGLASEIGGSCGACRACEAVCPAGIPIARVQARLSAPGAAGPARGAVA